MVATGTGIAPYRGFVRRLFVEETCYDEETCNDEVTCYDEVTVADESVCYQQQYNNAPTMVPNVKLEGMDMVQ